VLVRNPSSGTFSTADDRLLSAVGAQIASAIERAELETQATEAEILRRTDELRTALLNAVSHDLRTPLSSIIASADSILQRDVQWTEDERRDFAGTIEQEARRLNRLVGNLLDLSRIQAGSLVPQKGWYDLGAVIDGVLGRLRPPILAHRVKLQVPDNLPPIYFDYVEIDAVLTNIIENAVKYTPRDSEIQISVHLNKDEVLVEIADDGPGIPEDALPRIFDPFYRAPGAGVGGGTGLGLAVAKGLVEAHGGEMTAQNSDQGGALFSFTLPTRSTDSA
jgi:two-component system sensor histidine kinase KdpD